MILIGYSLHHLSSLFWLEQVKDFTCLSLNDDITENPRSPGHDLTAEVDESLAFVKI